MENSYGALQTLLDALLEVRACGTEEPRAAAERLVLLVGQLVDTLPTGKRRAERKDQNLEFDRLALAFGVAQKDFTLVARRDLGYDKPLRRHRWQLWRPRWEPEWPGGWPVQRTQEGQ
jgi:hypothetical protein